MSVDRRVVALSIFVLMSVRLVCAQAADEGAVTGIVVEADRNWKLQYDNPVIGALVTALSDGDIQKKRSDLSSDIRQRPTRPPAGAFTIPGLRLDNWCFVAYKDGYNSYPLAKKKLTTVIARDT